MAGQEELNRWAVAAGPWRAGFAATHCKIGKAGMFSVVEDWMRARLFVVDGGQGAEGYIM